MATTAKPGSELGPMVWTGSGWLETSLVWAGPVAAAAGAAVLCLASCVLLGQGKPALQQLVADINIWYRQVADVCQPKETIEWLGDMYGDEGWHCRNKGNPAAAGRKVLTIRKRPPGASLAAGGQTPK